VEGSAFDSLNHASLIRCSFLKACKHEKILLALAIAATPLLATAVDVNVNLGNVRIDAPGVSVTFGSRNDRGYYWDGYDWREPTYWREHNGHRVKSTIPVAAIVAVTIAMVSTARRDKPRRATAELSGCKSKGRGQLASPFLIGRTLISPWQSA
jgi:hypothetical protein